MTKEQKLIKTIEEQHTQFRNLISRVSGLTDRVTMLERELKTFKQDASKDISTLVERTEILKKRVTNF